ncbi:MAG: hypothetical protein JJE07_06890, partial [Flavobacteriaceae bacterium]|nr:hypothetical protein [Flavobacteriaceae bacterium]
PGTKSVSKQIKDVLKTITPEELALFVEETSKSDRRFRNLFLASFGHLSDNQSKEFYQKQIHSILKTAAGRDGFIDWSEMKYVVNTTEAFVINAEKYFEQGNYKNAIYISSALLEEMTEAFQYGDDSNGDLGYFIDAAMEMLYKVAAVELPKEIRELLFKYCIETFKKGEFSGWDWHLGMLQIAADIADDINEAEMIIKCLDTAKGEYELEQAQFLKLDLLRKFKDEKEVEKFIAQHISNASIRRAEIEKAFQNKNFDKAIALSKNGIEIDEKDKLGLANEWYEWLLKIAQAQNDIPKIIEYARFRLFHDFRGTQDYYQILKNTVDKKEWNAFLEGIINEITPKSYWKYTELARKIYINEEWWDRLFLLLKENVSLQNIEENEKYLSKNYTPELLELYSERITNYVGKYMGRDHYQTACRYLRRMKKLGATGEVDLLIATFRKEYPKRKALLDELNRV